MPKSEKINDDEEKITVDGQSFTFRIPKVMKPRADGKPSMAELSHRPPGARDLKARLVDLDESTRRIAVSAARSSTTRTRPTAVRELR